MPVMNDVGLKYSSPSDILAHYNNRFTITVPFMAASVDSNVYVATRPCRVTAVYGVTRVAGGASAAADIEKCTGTTAPGSGTDITTAPFDGTETADTVQALTLVDDLAALTLAVGDRLAMDVSGTLTSLVSVIVVELQPL